MWLHADELQLQFNSVNDQCVSCSALNSCWRSQSMFFDSETLKDDCAMYTVSHVALPGKRRICCLQCEAKARQGLLSLLFVRLYYRSYILSCSHTAVVSPDARSTFAE